MAEKKKPTLETIALKAGVSKSTVSLALAGSEQIGEDTRRRILRLAEELNYSPPRRRADAELVRNIGIMLNREFYFVGERFFTNIIDAFETEAAKENYHILLSVVDKEQLWAGQVPTFWQSEKTEALVIVGITDADLVHALAEVGKPVVLLSPGFKQPTEFDCVLEDDFGGVRKAVQHLVELGHQDIAFIGGHLDHFDNLERYRGFKTCMEEYLGGYNPDLIEVAEEHTTLTTGRKACNKLLDKEIPFSALICICDVMAYGAIEVLKQRGFQIPQDISVTGFDDLEYSAHFDPPLTTVGVDQQALGEAAFHLVSDRLRGLAIRQPIQVVIPSELIQRDSSGRPGRLSDRNWIKNRSSSGR